MNDNQTRRGPGKGLLLLIPVALIIARGARRRRAMWSSQGDTEPHRHGFGGDFDMRRGGAFRMPPKLEWMLDAWHTRAHEAADEAEPSPATGTATV